MLNETKTEFTEEERKVLGEYVTNTAGNIFAWKLGEKLDSESSGALLSRYSRSAMTSREIFLKEFLPNRSKGREFFNAWLIDYGDDSIQEMAGGIPVSTEYISNVAAKELEDSRLASYIEKSSRYVQFDKQIPGFGYPFYKGSDITESRLGTEYLELMQSLFDSYSRSIPVMADYIKKENPLEKQKFQIGREIVSGSEAIKHADSLGLSAEDLQKAYERSIKASALDIMRDYLPMSTLTHVGVSANARSYEHMILKLMASSLKESNGIGKGINDELKKIAPSLIRRVEEEHGRESIKYMQTCEYETRMAVSKAIASMNRDGSKPITIKPGQKTDSSTISLTNYTGKEYFKPDMEAVAVLVGTIIYVRESSLSLSESIKTARALPESDANAIIGAYVGERKNRRQRPGRAFENISYTFDMKGTVGAYRDLQRHRMITQERKLFNTEHGYVLREQYKAIGISEDYSEKMGRAADLHKKMSKELSPEQAQYAVTFGYNARWYINTNARELFHIAELRTTPAGHPDYREMVQTVHKLVRDVHPSMAKQMNFVNMDDTKLGRLSSEIRIAVKSSKLKG